MSEAQVASPTVDKPQGPTSPSFTDSPLRDTVDSLKNQLADFQTELSQWQQKANKAEREARQLRQILLELRSNEEQRGGEGNREAGALSPTNSRQSRSGKRSARRSRSSSDPPYTQPGSPHGECKGPYVSPQTSPKESKSPKGRSPKGSMIRQVEQKQAHYGWQNYPMGAEKQGQRSGRQVTQQQQHLGVGRANQQHDRNSPSHKYLKKPTGPAPADATKVAAEEALIECRQSLRNASDVKSLQGAIETAKSLGMKHEATFGEAKLAKMAVVA
eukprot:GEMP01005142.1.p1 GENE.GEMP01005142.1~~GEMP01005142.1.p1  ORF type:complete len:273 (-),score=80.01 GEMP01005142.1:3195-4013(-)